MDKQGIATPIEQLEFYIKARLPYPALKAWIDTLSEDDRVEVLAHMKLVADQAVEQANAALGIGGVAGISRLFEQMGLGLDVGEGVAKDIFEKLPLAKKLSL